MAGVFVSSRTALQVAFLLLQFLVNFLNSFPLTVHLCALLSEGTQHVLFATLMRLHTTQLNGCVLVRWMIDDTLVEYVLHKTEASHRHSLA